MTHRPLSIDSSTGKFAASFGPKGISRAGVTAPRTHRTTAYQNHDRPASDRPRNGTASQAVSCIVGQLVSQVLLIPSDRRGGLNGLATRYDHAQSRHSLTGECGVRKMMPLKRLHAMTGETISHYRVVENSELLRWVWS